MTDVFFKIRDKVTGLYSTGGQSPKWRKRGGKVWKTAAHLSSHLRHFDWFRKYQPPLVPPDMQTWEVVHLRQEEVAAQPLGEYLLGRKILAEDKRRKSL